LEVKSCDFLIVIPTLDGPRKGFIGRGVKQQIDAANSANARVFLYDEDDGYLIPFNAWDYCVLCDPSDWNRVALIEWKRSSWYSMLSFVKEMEDLKKLKDSMTPKKSNALDEFDWSLADSLPPEDSSRYVGVNGKGDDRKIGNVIPQTDKKILFRLR